MTATNLFAAGFTELCSVIPPGAKLSPKSDIRPEMLGKIPGRRNRSGTWGGYDWLRHKCTEKDAKQWEKDEANIGLIARNFPALDLDIDNARLREIVQELALEVLGDAPIRHSVGERRLLVYRTNVPFGRLSLQITIKGKTHTVECLCDGRQYVVHGTHPSGNEYAWEREPLWETTPDGDLALITRDMVETLFDQIEEGLYQSRVPFESKRTGGIAGTDVHIPVQDDLLAPTLSELRALVRQMPNDKEEREQWVEVGMAIKAAGAQWPEKARRIFSNWCSRWEHGENDPEEVDAFWRGLRGPFRIGWSWLVDNAPREITAQQEFTADLTGPPPAPADAATAGAPAIHDFIAYLPTHTYVYLPTREYWLQQSVNAKVVFPGKQKPAAWLDQNRRVEQQTWAPGKPLLIRDRLIADGGWFDKRGDTCLNLYRPPVEMSGNTMHADLWVFHVRRIYGEHAQHIIRFLAHRVQRPGEKINHALVLGGNQGIGKDTLLEPVKHAVGPWNFVEISPSQLAGRFNGFVKSVVLRISEARDLGDTDRFTFYERMKAYAASPPDVLRCDEKYISEYSVANVCSVIITTNNKTTGIYLPPDDRRHYVAWSDLSKEDFNEEYWNRIWNWYHNENGFADVAEYLKHYDLTDFNAKAPPAKTAVWQDIVDANRPPEDAELRDVLDKWDNPDAVTVSQLVDRADFNLGSYLTDRKYARMVPQRMEEAGYVRVPYAGDKHNGLWRIYGKRQVIYAKKELSPHDRAVAAGKLQKKPPALEGLQ